MSPSALPRASGFAVERRVLGNGLVVLLAPDPSLPLVSLQVHYRVGSRNERPGITGISHLFEHMMFNGAAKYGPKEFDRALERHGGASNASTSWDATIYHEEFPPDALPLAIELEADRMAALAITESSLRSEGAVVREERRVSVDDDPDGDLLERLYGLAFESHPYGWPIVGRMADLFAITVEDLRAYFRVHYAPGNAALVVVGAFEPRETRARIETAFGGIPAGPAPPPVAETEPERRAERRLEFSRAAEVPAIALGWRGPAAREGERPFVADAIARLLAGSESGRLTRRLVRREERAVSVAFECGLTIDPGLLVAFVKVRPGGDPAAVEAVVREEVARLAREDAPADELGRATSALVAGHLRELRTMRGRGEAIGRAEALLGDPEVAFSIPDRYRSIDAASVRELASSLFRDERLAVVTLRPSPAP